MTDKKKKPSLTGYAIGGTIGAGAGAGLFAHSDKLEERAKAFSNKSAKATKFAEAPSYVTRFGKVENATESAENKLKSKGFKSVKAARKTMSGKDIRHSGTWTAADNQKHYPSMGRLKNIKSSRLVGTVKRFKAAQALGAKEFSGKISEIVKNNPVKLILGSALLGSAFMGGAMQKEASVKLAQVKSFKKIAALDFGGILNAGKKLAAGIGKHIPGKAGELARAEVTHLPGAVAGAIKSVPKVDPSNPLGIIKTYKPKAPTPLTGLSTVKG